MMDAISEVLEKMFFVSVDFDRGGAPEFSCRHESCISLSDGNRRIDLSFRVTDPFARLITANLLGVDEEEVTPDDMEDTMKELANMVGGNYQSRMKDSAWELGIPATGNSEGDALAPETVLSFAFLGDPAGLVGLQTGA